MIASGQTTLLVRYWASKLPLCKQEISPHRERWTMFVVLHYRSTAKLQPCSSFREAKSQPISRNWGLNRYQIGTTRFNSTSAATATLSHPTKQISNTSTDNSNASSPPNSTNQPPHILTQHGSHHYEYNSSSPRTSSFKLSRAFVEKFKDVKPPFGFNGLGNNFRDIIDE